LIVAREAPEGWFLTDPGICSWLGVPLRPDTASVADPKRLVATAYYQKTRRQYQQATALDYRRNNSLAATIAYLTGCRIVTTRPS